MLLPKLENTGTNILQPGSPNTSARLPRLPRLNPSCQPIRGQYYKRIVQSGVSITLSGPRRNTGARNASNVVLLWSTRWMW